jgi:hypothetical protein
MEETLGNTGQRIDGLRKGGDVQHVPRSKTSFTADELVFFVHVVDLLTFLCEQKFRALFDTPVFLCALPDTPVFLLALPETPIFLRAVRSVFNTMT